MGLPSGPQGPRPRPPAPAGVRPGAAGAPAEAVEGWPAEAHRLWEDHALATLMAYVRVPCLSPAFDPGWEEAGHLAAAARLLREWCAARDVPWLTAEVVEIPGRTPALVVEAPGRGAGSGEGTGSVLVYGHLDKQPPLGEWRPGLGPYEPVRRGEDLFGRGAADDGYAVFAAVAALGMLSASGLGSPRVTVLIEASEESGSPDLPAHLEDLAPRLGRPDLVVCLDSGALSYDRLWLTSSLRGVVVATVTVRVLEEGVHSGAAGGVVPSSFRLLRRLLSRVEDETTGEILLPELRAAVPPGTRRDLEEVAAALPSAVSGSLPAVAGLGLAGNDEADRLVARAWTPALEVIGIDGVPETRHGGNVLRPYTAAKLSLRLPPPVDAERAAAALDAALRADPPDGAAVSVDLETPAQGWTAPDVEPWVGAALARGSLSCFGRPPAAYGEGGTIPFLSLLGARFPGVPMVALGVLGPASNAHGPNERLHVPMAEAVTVAVAHLLAATASRRAAV